MKRAFGLPEALILLALVALTAFGVAETALRRAQTPAWLRPMAMEVWT